MITHGKKQISEIVYARKASEGGGAVRLTNIIRGAQVVFGGTVGMWLKYATRASILAAFGQTDGYAVLGATNAYLNAIAATDPTKASALAGFINEDPMLVCSLGLQPQGVQMPKRYIESLGNAWFDLGIYNESNDLSYECEWYEPTLAGSWSLFGSTGDSSSPGRWSGVWYHPSAGTIYSATGNTDAIVRNSYIQQGWNKLTASYTDGTISAVLNNNNLSATYSGSVQNNMVIALFADKNASSAQEIAPSGIRVTYWKKDESGHNHWFVPYRKPIGDSYTVELLDLETGNLATKYGSFTIPDIIYNHQ